MTAEAFCRAHINEALTLLQYSTQSHNLQFLTRERYLTTLRIVWDLKVKDMAKRSKHSFKGTQKPLSPLCAPPIVETSKMTLKVTAPKEDWFSENERPKSRAVRKELKPDTILIVRSFLAISSTILSLCKVRTALLPCYKERKQPQAAAAVRL